jgi:hypothetical protein
MDQGSVREQHLAHTVYGSNRSPLSNQLQKLHDLLLQTTSNDTNLVRAVSLLFLSVIL